MFRRDRESTRDNSGEQKLDNEGLRRMREAIRQRLDTEEPAAEQREATTEPATNYRSTEGGYSYERQSREGGYSYLPDDEAAQNRTEERGSMTTEPTFMTTARTAESWEPAAPAPSQPLITTVAADTAWQGTLRSSADIRIEGAFGGEIHTDHGVYIANDAKVDATVHAASITVAGQLAGQVNCRERLEVLPNGRVSGQIDAGAIVVHEGAFLGGQLRMTGFEASTTTGAGASTDTDQSRPMLQRVR